MKPRANSLVLLLLAVAGFWSMTGCSLPPAQPDPTRFYVLSARAAAGQPVAGGAAIHLSQIEVASYLKARPLIVRRGDNEIEFREYARWGEALELGVARILREELLAQGVASAVLAPGLRAATLAFDYELTVRVLACEGGADQSVRFRAAWELATTGAKAAVAAQGDYVAAGLRWDVKNEASLAAELSRAVTGLAGEIAAGVPKK
ncbi:MAG: hypothetical protein EXS38_10315 [Opitutus sp.]|nr:hypothetical protein [Opitutus sp.]